MRKLEFFFFFFSVNLSVVALPIVPKVEFIFQIMLYIVIFLYESTGSCFKSVIGNQNSLESTPIDRFVFVAVEGKIFHQKSLMTQYTLIFHSEAT